MTNHPYPDTIRLAVATNVARQVLVMRNWNDLPRQTQDAFLKDADEILTTMWDACRVDLGDRVDHLPGDAIILAHNGQRHTPATFQASATADHYHAAIVYWGTP